MIGRLVSPPWALLLALSGLAAGSVAQARDLAGELKDAQAALAAGDVGAAYQAYLEHSPDNPLAEFTLGLFYQYGWGRPADPVEACRWEEKAAVGGVPAAELMLADCLRRGVHRPADATAAVHWYEQAALSGILTAPCDLAEMYMTGEGVPKQPRKALDLCGGAAEKGLAIAQLRVARFYLEGDPSIRDPAAALPWMQAAAQGNNAEAQYRLGVMLRDGVGRTADKTMAREWLESAASRGWLAAYLPTAELYFSAPVSPEDGLLPAKDLAKAYLWAAAAVERLPPGPDAKRARALLKEVTARMPKTWRPALDRRIDQHLAEVGLTAHKTPRSR